MFMINITVLKGSSQYAARRICKSVHSYRHIKPITDN